MEEEEEEEDDNDAADGGVRENLRLRIEVLDLKNRLDSAEESLSTAVAGGVPSHPSLLRIAQRSSPPMEGSGKSTPDSQSMVMARS